MTGLPVGLAVCSITASGGTLFHSVNSQVLARYGKPEIFNTDQGSQFTGQTFPGALAGNGIAISMDGKGAWRDNVFVELKAHDAEHFGAMIEARSRASG